MAAEVVLMHPRKAVKTGGQGDKLLLALAQKTRRNAVSVYDLKALGWLELGVGRIKCGIARTILSGALKYDRRGVVNQIFQVSAK